jgi:hypothetical protein
VPDADKTKVYGDFNMEDSELKNILESFWTACPEPGYLKEYDGYVSGVDSGEAGAERLMPSGEAGHGSEVRIRFRQPKR